MNVSRHGYYTTEYIDHRRHGSPRTSSTPATLSPTGGSPTSMQFSDDVSAQPSKHLRFDLPSQTPSEIDVGAHPDALPEDITPAQLTYIHKGQVQQERPRASVSYDNYYRPSRKQPAVQYVPFEDPSISDEVSLAHTEKLLFDERRPRKREEPMEYKGYYIDQKKRFDEAEFVKPRLYTHKTFKDIFKTDTIEERYNPIDLVFEDPQEQRDLEQKRKFTRTVRNLLKKIAGSEYESYDYHRQQALDEERQALERERQERKAEKALEKSKKKEKRKRLGFLSKRSAAQTKEDSTKEDNTKEQEEDDVFVKTTEADSENDEEVAVANGKRLRNNIKEKLSLARKQLGDNYFDNYAKNVEETELMRNNRAVADAMDQEHGRNDEYALGPNSNFHPVWNYLLSFLVYSQPTGNGDTPREMEAPPNKIVEVTEPDTKKQRALAVKEKNPGRKLKKKLDLLPYKQVLQNWNQPASAYLAGQRVAKRGDSARNLQVEQYEPSIPSVNEFPEEHVVFYEDDGMVDDELVYDPKTGTFLPAARAPMMATNGSKFSNLNYITPARVMLSLLDLIKSIELMKRVLRPVDMIGERFPSAQTFVILVELVIFLWLLYELSLLIDAICMAVKAVCAPMIAIGKFMNKIV